MTLEEKYNALKQSHQEVVDMCNDLEMQIVKHISFINKCSNEIGMLEAKLKAADEVVESVDSYISDTVYDRDKFDKLYISLKYYKSIK